MVTPDVARAIRQAGGGVIALTLLGAIAALIDPALGGPVAPHPTLTGTIGQALDILQSNARILAAPFLLAILRLPTTRTGRAVGDLAVLALAAVSTLSVGVELGRWGQRLIPYLAHLPLEWAALSLSLAAWLLIRGGHAPTRQLIALAATTGVLLIAAAGVETYATPHRISQVTARRPGGATPAGWGLMQSRDLASARLAGTVACSDSRSERTGSAPALRRPTSTPDLGGTMPALPASCRGQRMAGSALRAETIAPG